MQLQFATYSHPGGVLGLPPRAGPRPRILAPAGSLRFPLTNQPGDIIVFTPMNKQHIQIIYGPYDWDDALFYALLEITGDSDD